jgi:cell division protein FtsW (lipid II flippase)
MRRSAALLLLLLPLAFAMPMRHMWRWGWDMAVDATAYAIVMAVFVAGVVTLTPALIVASLAGAMLLTGLVLSRADWRYKAALALLLAATAILLI